MRKLESVKFGDVELTEPMKAEITMASKVTIPSSGIGLVMAGQENQPTEIDVLITGEAAGLSKLWDRADLEIVVTHQEPVAKSSISRVKTEVIAFEDVEYVEEWSVGTGTWCTFNAHGDTTCTLE